ncbi:hypothetical protein AB0D10_00510 [Kitasatospora sp. NPDC048545]
MEDLVRDGTLDPEDAATARGLSDWALPDIGTRLGSASDAPHAMREEKDR